MSSREPDTLHPAVVEPDDDLVACVEEGKQALSSGDLETALKVFEQVVQRFPERPEGHNNLGALFAALGEYERAENCFDQVLKILPDQPNVLYNRGIVRSRRQEHAAAAADFERVAQLTPEDGDAWNNLGVSIFLQEKPGEARAHFERALQEKPNDVSALLNLCDAQSCLGERDVAIKAARNFLARNPDSEVRLKLLEMLADRCRGVLTEAAREAERLLADNDTDAETRALLGRLLQARASLAPKAREAAASA